MRQGPPRAALVAAELRSADDFREMQPDACRQAFPTGWQQLARILARYRHMHPLARSFRESGDLYGRDRGAPLARRDLVGQ